MEFDLGITKLIVYTDRKTGNGFPYSLEDERALSSDSLTNLMVGLAMLYVSNQFIYSSHSIDTVRELEKIVPILREFIQFRVSNNNYGELLGFWRMRTPESLRSKEYKGLTVELTITDSIINTIPKIILNTSIRNSIKFGFKYPVKYKSDNHKALWISKNMYVPNLYSYGKGVKTLYPIQQELSAYVIKKTIEAGNFSILKTNLLEVF